MGADPHSGPVRHPAVVPTGVGDAAAEQLSLALVDPAPECTRIWTTPSSRDSHGPSPPSRPASAVTGTRTVCRVARADIVWLQACDGGCTSTSPSAGIAICGYNCSDRGGDRPASGVAYSGAQQVSVRAVSSGDRDRIQGAVRRAFTAVSRTSFLRQHGCHKMVVGSVRL